MQGCSEDDLERDWQGHSARDFHHYLRRHSQGDSRRNSQDDLQGDLRDDLLSYLWGGCRDDIGYKRVGNEMPDSIAAIRVYLCQSVVVRPDLWILNYPNPNVLRQVSGLQLELPRRSREASALHRPDAVRIAYSAVQLP
jgi:hypothetical protein